MINIHEQSNNCSNSRSLHSVADYGVKREWKYLWLIDWRHDRVCGVARASELLQCFFSLIDREDFQFDMIQNFLLRRHRPKEQ
jgi:hypothetical protein